MKFSRSLRINEEIKHIITDMIIEGKIKSKTINESKSIISITRVDVVNDLKYATIYVSVFGNDLEDIVLSLNKISGFIRSEIGKKIKLRYTPELKFVSDTSIKDAMEMIEKIDRIAGKNQD